MGINKETVLVILRYMSLGYPIKAITNQLQINEKIVINILFRNEVKKYLN